jgi:hypothetical protein
VTPSAPIKKLFVVEFELRPVGFVDVVELELELGRASSHEVDVGVEVDVEEAPVPRQRTALPDVVESGLDPLCDAGEDDVELKGP